VAVLTINAQDLATADFAGRVGSAMANFRSLPPARLITNERNKKTRISLRMHIHTQHARNMKKKEKKNTGADHPASPIEETT